VAAGAKIHSLEMAATAGGITGWPLHRFTLQSRLRVLVFAADHQRLEVIDRLVAAGTPVNEPDAECERLPLHTVAGNGVQRQRPATARPLRRPQPPRPQARHHPTGESQRESSSEPSHAELLEEAGRASCLRVPDQAGEAQPNRPRTGPEAS